MQHVTVCDVCGFGLQRRLLGPQLLPRSKSRVVRMRHLRLRLRARSVVVRARPLLLQLKAKSRVVSARPLLLQLKARSRVGSARRLVPLLKARGGLRAPPVFLRVKGPLLRPVWP